MAADIGRERFVIWVPRGWLAAGVLLAVVGIFTISGGYAWPVVVLAWVLIVGRDRHWRVAWNRRDRGEGDKEGWI